MTPEALAAIRTRDYFACEDNFIKTKTVATRLIQGAHRAVPPRFTIIIPTYNKPQLLALAVRSALAQPGGDYQVLVVDDLGIPGPESGTAEAMRQLADERLIYYANEQNLGLFANWNRCFELAQSEWVIMLHDDDLLTADYMGWVRSALAAAPRADLVGVQQRGFAIDPAMTDEALGRITAPEAAPGPQVVRPVCPTQLQFGPGVVWQGSCIRRTAFLEMGGAQLGTRLVRGEPIGAYYGQDYCMIVRFAHRFRCYRLARPLYCVGEGANSSRNVWEWQDALVEQHYCSRFLAKQYPLMGGIARRTAQKRILDLARAYNSGESYIGVRAGLDLELLAKECELPGPSVTPAMEQASRLWGLYEKVRMAASHRGDKRLTPPQQGETR